MKLLLGIAVAVLALADAGQSPLQRRVVKDVLDYFHSRSNVQFLFREQSVEGAVERVSAGGARGPPSCSRVAVELCGVRGELSPNGGTVGGVVSLLGMQSTTGPPGPARWCQLARHGAQLLINHTVGRTEQWPVPCCPLAGHGVPFLSPPRQGAGGCGVGLY